jgi:hypothetical protein
MPCRVQGTTLKKRQMGYVNLQGRNEGASHYRLELLSHQSRESI